MFRKLTIGNFKSIEQLELELGRVTVLIGANGSGKSNILEAIALASAAAGNKLDNEFLVSRGVRVTETRFMRAAFATEVEDSGIDISLFGDNPVSLDFFIYPRERASYPRWEQRFKTNAIHKALERFWAQNPGAEITEKTLLEIGHQDSPLREFLVYSPENSALRTFQREGQILPLGINGEGLFAHLKALAARVRRALACGGS